MKHLSRYYNKKQLGLYLQTILKNILLFSPTFVNSIVTQPLKFAKPYGLVNQKLCYIQMLLNVEKSGEQGLRPFLKNGR